MGYDFALDDKVRLRYLEEITGRLLMHKSRYNDRYHIPEAELNELKEEALEAHRERYELINLRKEEMGYKLANLEELEQDFRENYL